MLAGIHHTTQKHNSSQCHRPRIYEQKNRNFEQINSMDETNGNFDPCNSRNGWASRLHELHESKFSFVTRIEFIRSKFSNFSAHVSGLRTGPAGADNHNSSPSASRLIPYRIAIRLSGPAGETITTRRHVPIT